MPYNKEIKGWMTEPELQLLERWAQELPPNANIIEVGSYHGRSAYCFAASAPTATVYCYDLWDNYVEPENPVFPLQVRLDLGFPLPGSVNSLNNFKNNVKDLKNIRAIRVFSADEIDWPNEESVDLFFLDSAHTNPADWEYIQFWLPRIKKGAYISGHDLYESRHMPAVNDNVERLEQVLGNKVETFGIGSLWRIRK
jgi:hypothetical protein